MNFKNSILNTNIKNEFNSALTIFFTSFYVVFVLPIFLIASGVDGTVAFIAVCLGLGISSILMGIFTNLPLAMGATSSSSSILAYSIMINMGYSYEEALTFTFISGLMVIALSFFISKDFLKNAIPNGLKLAFPIVIGAFLIVISIKNLEIINISTIDNYSLAKIILSILAVITLIFLPIKKYPLLPVILIAILAIINYLFFYSSSMEASTNLNFNFKDILFIPSFENIVSFSALAAIISIFIMTNFDTAASILSYNYLSKSETVNDKFKNILKVQGVAVSVSSLIGSPATAVYLESTLGLKTGAKTGLTPILIGIMFLITISMFPLLKFIPIWATSFILFILGFSMFLAIKDLLKSNFSDYLPAIFGSIVSVASFSIIFGIAVAFLSFTVLKLISKKHKEITKTTAIITIILILIVKNDILELISKLIN